MPTTHHARSVDRPQLSVVADGAQLLKRPDALPTWKPPRAIAQRASDRAEPWTIENPSVLDGFLDAAHAAKLPLSTATALVMERRLIHVELTAIGVAFDDAVLDEAAAAERLEASVWSGSRAYLAGLRGGTTKAATSSSGCRTIALPARLSDRLPTVWPPDPPPQVDELDSALCWETASVASGLTMTEWAQRELLRSSGLNRDY